MSTAASWTGALLACSTNVAGRGVDTDVDSQLSFGRLHYSARLIFNIQHSNTVREPHTCMCRIQHYSWHGVCVSFSLGVGWVAQLVYWPELTIIIQCYYCLLRKYYRTGRSSLVPGLPEKLKFSLSGIIHTAIASQLTNQRCCQLHAWVSRMMCVV